MNRTGDRVAYPGHSTKGVGAGSQMGPLAKFFKRMSFLLQRILFRVGPTVDRNGCSACKLCRLPFAARGLYLSAQTETLHPAVSFLISVLIILQIAVTDDLDIGHAAAIVQLDKKLKPALESLPGANPSLQHSTCCADGGFIASRNATESVSIRFSSLSRVI